MFEVNDNLKWLLLGMFGMLCLGTTVRMVALRNSDVELKKKRMGSLRVWWTLAILMTIAVVFGIHGTAALLAVGGILGLKEYLNLIGVQKIGKPAMFVAFACVPLQYLLVTTGDVAVTRMILPAIALLAISTARLSGSGTDDFIRITAGVYWGVMLLAFSLSHAAMLFALPDENVPAVGMAGWFLFVVIITEMDDIFQALVGRLIGKHKVTPRISPNKTWEGCLGGVVTSVVLAFALAPWLTTFPAASTVRGFFITVGAGVAIFLAAFFGDINMSAIKRDVGVKDGSAILPGMGGIIDRVDSLTFTAPVFYYFVLFVLF